MRAEGAALASRAGRAARRRITAGMAYVRRPRLPAGYTWSKASAVPVAARVDADLVLARHQSSFAEAVVEELATRAIHYWWLPTADLRGRALCVGESDRDIVLATVSALAGPAWYVDIVGADGEPTGRYVPAGSRHGRAFDRAPGMMLWEFVTPREGSTFLADAAQGLTAYFWRVEGARFVCRVRNLVATAVEMADVATSGSTPNELASRSSGAVGFPIDVVYTWVDGADDAWVRAKAEAAEVADPQRFTERAHDEARFADHDELRFSLRALEQFAPWANHVWIVTAGQRPAWLDPNSDWVTVVDHREIWPDELGLPTFNSHAVEAGLHRIPGLAEHFIYLNDDTLLGRPVRPETFFHPNGIGRFFQSRALVPLGAPEPGEIASSTAAKNARRLIRERYGVTFTRKFFHTGAPLTVSGLAELEATFPDVIGATRRAQFRTVDDVAMAGSFYLNWAYVVGRSVPGALRYTYIDPAAPEAPARLRMVLARRPFDALCINDGTTEQTLEGRRQTDRLIRGFFADYLPVPGTFELTRTGR